VSAGGVSAQLDLAAIAAKYTTVFLAAGEHHPADVAARYEAAQDVAVLVEHFKALRAALEPFATCWPMPPMLNRAKIWGSLHAEDLHRAHAAYHSVEDAPGAAAVLGEVQGRPGERPAP